MPTSEQQSGVEGGGEPVADPRSGESLRTRDMTLAAYLALEGFDYKLEKDGKTASGHPLAAWCFFGTGVKDAATKFNEGGARVEPDRFSREMRRVRGVLYEYLGMGSGSGNS